MTTNSRQSSIKRYWSVLILSTLNHDSPKKKKKFRETSTTWCFVEDVTAQNRRRLCPIRRQQQRQHHLIFGRNTKISQGSRRVRNRVDVDLWWFSTRSQWGVHVFYLKEDDWRHVTETWPRCRQHDPPVMWSWEKLKWAWLTVTGFLKLSHLVSCCCCCCRCRRFCC